jgi:predicted secreted protein
MPETTRPAGVALVAHCLLNQNSKVAEGAICAGVHREVVDALRERGWRIEQMPCPELAFTGLNRFWAVREQLDTGAYRRHCRRIAEAVAGAAAAHAERGLEVVLVGLEGSPSMGVRVTSSDDARRGRPAWADGTGELVPGPGIFVEELQEALARRGLQGVRATGSMNVFEEYDPEVEREELHAFLDGA